MNSVIQMIGPVWAVRILTTFRILSDMFSAIASMTVTSARAIMNFLNGTSSRWVFLRGGIGPIPAVMVRNYMSSPIVTWVYDSQSNTLYYMNRDGLGAPVERTLPILSLGITTPSRTYSADEFNAMFSYSSPRGVSPNPRLLLYCWSVHSSVWFAPNPVTEETPVLTIIDQNGESIDQPVFFRSDEHIAQWDTLFREDVDDEESESGSETGSASGTDADEDDNSGTDGDDEGEGDVESEEEAVSADDDGNVESEEETASADDDVAGEGEEDAGEEEDDANDVGVDDENATPTVTTELSDA